MYNINDVKLGTTSEAAKFTHGILKYVLITTSPPQENITITEKISQICYATGQK